MTPPDKPTAAPEPEAKISEEAKEAGIYLRKKIRQGRDNEGPYETINVGLIVQRAIDAATRELLNRDLAFWKSAHTTTEQETVHLSEVIKTANRNQIAAVRDRDAARAMVVELREALQLASISTHFTDNKNEGTKKLARDIRTLLATVPADYAHLTVVSRERLERIERNLGDFVVRSEALVEFVRDPDTLLDSDPTEVLVDLDRLSRVARSLLIAEPDSARAKEAFDQERELESRLAAAVLERDAARAECAVKESTITNREALIYADKWNALSQAITQELSILFKDIDQIDKGNLTPQDQGQAEITRLRQAVAALTRLQKILWPGSDLKIKASTDAHLTVVSRERLEQTERVLTDLLCLTKAVFWIEHDKIAPENLKLFYQYQATALKLLGDSARAKEGT